MQSTYENGQDINKLCLEISCSELGLYSSRQVNKRNIAWSDELGETM